MGKIIEGHTFDEYQEKYGKKFKDGKLEFVPFSKDNQLNSDKKYWKIDDNEPGYYEITDKKPLIFFLAILGAIGTVTAVVVTSVMLTRPTPIGDFCKFTFDSEHSQIDVDGEKHHKIDISLKKGEKPDEIYYVYADEGYELETHPKLPDIIDYEITDGTKAKLSFKSPIVENITVTMPTTPVVDKVLFHFLGNNCKIDVDGKLEQEHTFELEKGKKPTETYYIKADTNYDLPETITDKPNIIDYSRDTSDITKATISFNSVITDNITVTVKANPQLVSFHFTGTNCKIKVNEDYVADYTFSLEKGKKPTETYYIKADTNYDLPETITDKPDIIDYSRDTSDITKATISFNSVITDNITVTVKANPQLVSFHFTGTNCKIKVNEDYLTDYTFSLEKGKKPTETYYIKADDDFALLTNPEIPSILTYTKVDDTNATLVFNDVLNNNVDVNINSISTDKKWYEYEDWWNYCSCGVKAVEADDKDIGHIVKLKVNNQDHDIRLIGLDHDDEVDGDGKIIGKAHTTFQFANLLCDKSGCSLGVIEDFEPIGYDERNYDYLNSLLRKNLTGKGNGQIMWFQKGGEDISQEYNNKTILDMLPQGLKDVLKDVKKGIYTDVNQQWEFKLTYYDDKLFVPTYREMFKKGSEYDWQFFDDEGTTYDYYLEDDPIRIFNQISSDEYINTPSINIFEGKLTATNYAGYCSGDPGSDANAYFASPLKDSQGNVLGVMYGMYEITPPTNDFALGVTPCFCI